MREINKYIDQTILKPEATEKDVATFVEDVIKYKFYAACVDQCWVPFVREQLPSDIKICSVVGFPLGASSTQIKVYEAQQIIKMGCDEIDMVMNIGRLKGKDYKYVGKEIKAVVEASHGSVVKVIIETCLLSRDEKIAAARIIVESGAQFVKTSTGFSKKGATIGDVQLLRKVVGPHFGVKASGGIKNYKSTVAMIDAGANRIGTSSGVVIMQGLQKSV